MIVHYHHMTGDELKRIWRISEMKQEPFLKLLGLKERHELSTQFDRRNKAIDKDVEDALNSAPELAQHKLVIYKDENVATDVATKKPREEPNDVVKILTDTLATLKDLVKDGRVQGSALIKALDKLSDTNDHVREEAVAYRKILMDGYDAGLLQWVKPKK